MLVEIIFTGVMVAVTIALSAIYHLPILLPASDSATFVGIHYLSALLALVTFGPLFLLKSRDLGYRKVVTALLCYAIVLWAHFNIKIWVPHINPKTYDALFWSVDQSNRPLIDICFAIREWMTCILPYEANAYMYSLIILFNASFIILAMRTARVFYTLFRAILFLQGLGGLAYLAFPAIGPFIFEKGINAPASDIQAHMLAIHDHSVRSGVAWLRDNGSRAFVAGLGAMPSLHAAGAFVFLWFIARHMRVLLPLYLMTFGYILVAAIATRWHYLVDLPAGIALAALCIYLAHRFDGEPVKDASAPAEPQAAPAGGWTDALLPTWPGGYAPAAFAPEPDAAVTCR